MILDVTSGSLRLLYAAHGVNSNMDFDRFCGIIVCCEKICRRYNNNRRLYIKRKERKEYEIFKKTDGIGAFVLYDCYAMEQCSSI